MDKTSKIILAFITGGLWINAAIPLVRPAHSQSDELAKIYAETAAIALNIQRIAYSFEHIEASNCDNDKICKRAEAKPPREAKKWPANREYSARQVRPRPRPRSLPHTTELTRLRLH